MPYSTEFRRIVCYALPIFLLVKIVGLEGVAAGWVHSLSELLTAGAFAVAAHRLGGGGRSALLMGFLAGLPWLMDTLNLPTWGLNEEGMLWFATQFYLSLLLAENLMRKHIVGRLELLDAVSLYLSSGLAFAELYGLLQWVVPGSLAHAGFPADAMLPFDLVLYYSFVTQATIGYGDVVPTTRLCRALCIVQSVYGVMFTALVIGRVLALHIETKMHKSGGVGGGLPPM